MAVLISIIIITINTSNQSCRCLIILKQANIFVEAKIYIPISIARLLTLQLKLRQDSF